jgi:hypothetical protein
MHKKVPLFFSVALFFSLDARTQEASPPVGDTVVAVSAEDRDTTAFTVLGAQEIPALRAVPKKRVDSLKAEEDYWYANAAPPKKLPPQAEKEDNGKGLFQQQWFRELLWVIVLCSFIGVVIWYLAASNILIFRKSAKKIISDDDGEVSTDDIFALDYNAEIAKAERANNFRLAVRLWYLQTLKDLAGNGLIEYQHGRTNSDYVTQLYNQSSYRDFFRLTRNFEYIWYGQFDLSAEAYSMMQADFSNFKNGQRR